MIAQGGQTIYGAPLGILMLEARFPRIIGDMGNALSWDFPVLYQVVAGATPQKVVREQAEGLLQDFIAAGQELIRQGARGITTNCGFLSLFQKELAAALHVPVATSALMQARGIQALLPEGRTLGILTISAENLSAAHLKAADVPEGLPLGGVARGCEFQRVILGDELHLDVERARQDMVTAALALQAAHPNLGAILFECTNMPPYAAAVKLATGLPVFSIVTMVNWFHEALR